MNILSFIFPFYCYEHLGCFLLSGVMNSIAMNILCVSFSEHIYTFLSHVYLRMEMLSHNIWIFRF